LLQNLHPSRVSLLQEKIGETLEDGSINNYFLNRNPIAQEIKARIEKWGCIRLKSFCPSKETIIRIRRQPTEQRKYSLSIQQVKGLMSRIYKELKKINSKTNNPIIKWANELNTQSSKKKYKWLMKKCSTSLVIKEIQIKTTLRFHLIPVRSPRKQTTRSLARIHY
jgi:hypothetical protein